MNVVILVHRLDEPRGSEKTQLALGEKLADRGHTVSFLSESGAPTDDCYPLEIDKENYNDPSFRVRILRHGWSVLRELSPDVIFAQNHNTLLAACYARRHRIPYVAFYHWPDMLSNCFSLGYSLRENLEETAAALCRPIVQLGYREADVSIVPSEFARSQWGGDLPGAVEVVYPFIPGVDEESTPGGDYVLHVTPTVEKGINVTLDVAETMRERRFVVIGRDPDPAIERRMNELRNVDYLGYIHDVASMYRSAWAVIVPSTTDEAFGMVPVEAGLYKTPALVSGQGGLGEAVADRFVVGSTDPDPYVDRLTTLTDGYDDHCATAYAYSQTKTAGPQFRRFREIVEAHTGVRL